MPVSAFEQTKQGSGTPSITINVSGISPTNIVAEEVDNQDIEDIEYKISDTE
jgi:predicted transcriptional regulator